MTDTVVTFILLGPEGASPAERWVAGARHAAALDAAHLAVVAGGGRVLFHCLGGCGRSGMAVLRLLVEMGEAPEAALERLRRVRPCAVETGDQCDWAARGCATAQSRPFRTRSW